MPRKPAAGSIIVPAWLLFALALSLIAAVTIGQAEISPADVIGTVWAHVTGGAPVLPVTLDAIVWELRVPRVLTAALVGGGLALCGAVMQALTRNPLADPYLLGLSSGASTGAVLVIILGAVIALPLAAFAGALVALVLTIALAHGAGSSPTAMVLAGLAVSAVLSALTSLVIFWSATGDSYREILNWLLGSLSGAEWPAATLAAVVLLICAVPLLGSARALDALMLGDTAAAALGISAAMTRALLFVSTAVLTGALVAVSGSIGFVGLVLPHIVRTITGPRHRALLPASLLAGAIFLVWSDTAARTVFEPRELPVGIVTALIGGPVFAVLMLRMHRGRS